MGQRAVQQFVPPEASQVQPRTTRSSAPGNQQPSVTVHRGAARLVQHVVWRGEEAVVDKRHVLRWDDVMLDVAEPAHRADSPIHVITEGIWASRGVGDKLSLPAGGQGADRGRVESTQIAADHLVTINAIGDRRRQRLPQRQGPVDHWHDRRRRQPPPDGTVPPVTVEYQVVIGRQECHPLPDRLSRQRVKNVGVEQMKRQALLIEPAVKQACQDVGPVRRDSDALHRGVEDPPDTGDRALDPDTSSHRGDQM
jgi:hypothetical protein